MLREVKRLFAVGLCKDLCVMDTALNAAAVVPEVFLVNDATRAVHLPGLGSYGTGFTADPAVLWQRMSERSVMLIQSGEIRC